MLMIFPSRHCDILGVMAERRILLCLVHKSGKEAGYVEKALKDDWMVPLGPDVDAFEKDLTNYIKSAPGTSMTLDADGITVWPTAVWGGKSRQIAVALSSGTAALHLALATLGIGAGDEVVCQSFTFCASCNPVVYLGATPVFVDSEPDTWNMDPELLRVAIEDRIARTGKKPKAIIPVYLYGMPAKMDEILSVAGEYDIPVVEDAAEALGSRYKGRICGTFGMFGAFSFNGNKMITTSGGGALICPDEKISRRVMYFATQARSGYPYYHHTDIGYNYRLSNVSAAIGRGQMTILDEHIAHHRRMAEIYEEEFREVKGITLHTNPGKDYDSNYWLNTILIDPKLRAVNQNEAYSISAGKAVAMGVGAVTSAVESVHTDCEPNANVEAMRLALAAEGIESRPLWKPMHLQPVYKNMPAYVKGVSESLFHQGLCLPSGPCVSEADARMIAGIIIENIER